MASHTQALTGSPAPIAGLTSGRRYTLQNRSRYVVLLVEAAVAPTSDEAAFTIDPGFERIVEKTSGEELYVWSKGSGELNYGRVVFAEAP